jgi:hypothetical protein
MTDALEKGSYATFDFFIKKKEMLKELNLLLKITIKGLKHHPAASNIARNYQGITPVREGKKY